MKGADIEYVIGDCSKRLVECCLAQLVSTQLKYVAKSKTKVKHTLDRGADAAECGGGASCRNHLID